LKKHPFTLAACLLVGLPSAYAEESLIGALKGAETLPQGALEIVQHVNYRSDKGTGSYHAWDSKTELEYGITNRLTGALYVLGQSVDSSGVRANAYIPADKQYDLRLSGIEASMKYNFLSPAMDDFGLAAYLSGAYTTLDKHSGFGKNKLTIETHLLAQKYFLDGQLIWVGNLGLESTRARRKPIAGIDDEDLWPTTPEMEVALLAGTGLSYRFAPNWFASAEVFYEMEHETNAAPERWFVQAGPSLHYGGKSWWATLSWLPQIRGNGKEEVVGQTDHNLHLIEGTKQEVRLKVGLEF
jgi:hypothetical protein